MSEEKTDKRDLILKLLCEHAGEYCKDCEYRKMCRVEERYVVKEKSLERTRG